MCVSVVEFKKSVFFTCGLSEKHANIISRLLNVAQQTL
jgi:hypothetical protein